MALRCLADVDNLESHLDRALIEYAAAGFHFEQAGNIRYLARVENNLGYLFFKIGRHQEAHKHLNRARLHFLELNDVGAVAQVDDTRARTLLAEGHLREAERFARSSVRTLEKGDEQALVAEALTTHGVALARLGNHPQAKALLQRAIDIAGTAGDLEGAGRAKLSIIEELSGQTTPTELAAIYQDAADLLRHTQDPSTNRRLIQCAGRVIKLLRTMESPVPAAETNSWEGFSFRKRLREFERILIERALQDAGGSVTKASRLLGFRHHQSLISLINTRHTDLLKIRSVVQKRRHHLFSEPKRTTPVPKEVRTVTILHAERDEAAASTLRELCAVQDWQVDYCPNGQAALEKLLSQERFDAMVLDCDLPELSGLELVLRARTMKHRHRIPIIMLSERECEIEAWRAGVDVFLRKPRDFQQVPKIISRLAKTPKGKN